MLNAPGLAVAYKKCDARTDWSETVCLIPGKLILRVHFVNTPAE
jgi:hypothetical protein